MNYRLALKLGLNQRPDGQFGGEAYLAWAALRLAEAPAQSSGQGALPSEVLEGTGEIRTVIYSDPQDMLDPMPLDAYEERLMQIMGTLPDGCVLVRVPFDRAAYTKWRGAQPDTSQTRAEWANGLEL